jgi:hypothetical protein
MRVIEDRLIGNRKLIVTLLAIKQLFLSCEFDNSAMAAQAFRAIRPAQPDKQLAAFGIGIKQIDYVN